MAFIIFWKHEYSILTWSPINDVLLPYIAQNVCLIYGVGFCFGLLTFMFWFLSIFFYFCFETGQNNIQSRLALSSTVCVPGGLGH